MNENEAVVINRRKNEKKDCVEVAKAYFNSMKITVIYRAILYTIAPLLLAFFVYKLTVKNYDGMTLTVVALVVDSVFALWLTAKPYIDGARMYYESALETGEDYVSETRISEDKIEYYSEDPDLCSSVPLKNIYNVFETANIYEILLTDENGNNIGHMLAKNGFVKGTLDDVRRLAPVGKRTPAEKA